MIVDLGASTEVTSFSQGRTALLDAAYIGNVELFEYFLNKGADIYARDVLGKTL